MKKTKELRLPDYLSHILQAIHRIEGYTAGLTKELFLEDEKTQDAVIRNFEIIGEASRNVERYHGAYTLQHVEVPWGLAYEMRNVLAHAYFEVDMEVVWQTIQDDLPTLADKIKALPEVTS